MSNQNFKTSRQSIRPRPTRLMIEMPFFFVWIGFILMSSFVLFFLGTVLRISSPLIIKRKTNMMISEIRNQN